MGPGQLEVAVRAGDGVPSQGDDHLDLVPAGQDKLVRARVVSLLRVEVPDFDRELVCTFLERNKC